MRPVQPYLMFPFKNPPERLIENLIRINEEPIILKGFQVYFHLYYFIQEMIMIYHIYIDFQLKIIIIILIYYFLEKFLY